MKKRKLLIGLASLFVLVALGLSAYLSYLSLTGGAARGCGADSGCGEVLASPWSKVGPIPVALLGGVVQLAVLLGLCLRVWSESARKKGDALVWFGVPPLIVAAVWFTYLQIFVLHAVCPYCLVGHALGFVAAALLAMTVLGRTRTDPVPPFAVGMIGVIALMAVQLLLPASDAPQRADNPFVDKDGDTWIDDARYVSVFGGELQFVLQDVPYIGDADAKQVVVLLFDYACPHCRTLHGVLADALEQDPARIVLVPLPLSIYEGQSEYISSDLSRFEDSAERAFLSMAVGAIDREKWQAFDRWLFSDDGDEFPRSAEDARAKAEALVGKEALDQQLAGDPRDRLLSNLQRNVDLIGLLPEGKRLIPVTTTPGTPAHLTERYDKIEVLYELLDSVELEADTSG